MNQIMKYILAGIIFCCFGYIAFSQNNSDKSLLKYNLNESGSHYFQVTFLNQAWTRWAEYNPGTMIDSTATSSGMDIGLRRTRIQVLGQINDRTFIYFQFGENNFNAQYALNGNRKLAAFFHDAICEYRLSPQNQLKIGGGLTIANGLSRFSQPSIGTIMTLDVPVFAQTTVDQSDQFSRKLSMYARGQIGHWDYRFVLSDPFSILSNGTAAPALNTNATFSPRKHHLQQQAYVMYQFFEHENHTTPYMTGTYLGKKKIFNIAAGAIYQDEAMWYKSASDTNYCAMFHWAIESFLDMPLNKEKQDAISAYIGYFNTNYGPGYLRYNGIMNPATEIQNNTTYYKGSYGNAIPMFGTGQVIYAQIGYLLPIQSFKLEGRLLPYASLTMAKYEQLSNIDCQVYNLGLNYLMSGHQSKISIDWQNRPSFYLNTNKQTLSGNRLNVITLQYQIFF